jgi:hypothetical protein
MPAAQLAAVLAVLPSELAESLADLRDLQPTAGRFEIDGDVVRFSPRFAFVEGTSYTLIVRWPGEDEAQTWTIARPRPTGTPSTRVVAIHPTADEIPMNQLRLYVHFSAAMSEGWATRSVHVRRADDEEPLEGALLAMEPELWSPDRRRLTLLLDPGRIKRGLLPNEQAGYPLVEGEAVVVTVDRSFRDAEGRPLLAGARRPYAVGPAVRERIDPMAWQLDPPAAGSRQALTVRFDRPLDHALLEHSLRVVAQHGGVVRGETEVGSGERSWQFVPREPWGPGGHVVEIEARLEDLAGNSIVRVFDRDLTRASDDPLDVARATLRFVCAEPVRGA